MEIERLDKLTALRSLSFWNNQIGEIKNLDNLTTLNSLNLWGNQITEIKNLGKLTALNSLNLWGNQIAEIENLDKLTSLVRLFLSGNQIIEIKNLDKLTALKGLHISENKINEIKNLDKLTTLTALDLGSNKISEIKNLDKLIRLTILDLSHNQISEIENLDQLTLLTDLKLSINQIIEIKNLDTLAALSLLNLCATQISEIKNLDKLKNLRMLDLSHNQISEIRNLSKLTSLTYLQLSSNQIIEIKNLDKLTVLTILDLSYNQISEIKNFDKLTTLKEIYLKQNQISRLPSSLIPLFGRIEKINLLDNPIKGTTITDWNNPKAILGYMQSQQDDQVINYHLKVNIIGEGRIGKTQLFKYWNKQIYKANQQATHGTLTTTLSIPGSEYKATIWDFGGQAYHHGFHHVFLRPNDFYLVLWRNDPEKKPDYGYWLGTARNFSRPSKKEYFAPVILAQNVWTETDRPAERTVHRPDEVIFPDSQKMQKYRMTLDDVFVIDVKCLRIKTGPWKARHDYFLSSLYHKMVEHAQNLLPKVSGKWLAVKEGLDEHPIEKINLTREEFQAQYAPYFDGAALAGLLDYLEFTGNIIKFPESSSLSEYVFPDPPKLSEWIYNEVLDKKFKNANRGIIDYAELEKLLGPEKAEIFREIMDEFHLIFPEKDNENNLVIPQFLPENNNSFKRLLLELIPYSFCLRFADFFHESRIFQFISEYGEHADDKTSYWRYGLVFTIDKVNALVYYNQEERTVFVHLENKKGRIKTAQRIFDYFVFKQKAPLYKEKKLSYFAHKYGIGIDSLSEIAINKGFKIKPNPNAMVSFEFNSVLAGELKWKDWYEELRNIAYGLTEEKTRLEKHHPDDLIEGAQLSINREDYIDIKETLRNNTDDFPVGISVKNRKRIKLDNLTLNLLGMINQKLPKVFISYSRQDLAFKDELKTHLSILERNGLLDAWSCEEIQAGTWDSQIQTQLEEADVIVYMVSQNFMASGYIMEQEVAKGIKMAQENPNKKIICVLVRNCLWKRWSFMEEKFKNIVEKDGKEVFSTDLSKYQFLPYHQYTNQMGIPEREEIVALEEWGRYPYRVSSVAFTQVADRILTEVTRNK